MLLATFMAAVEATIVATAMPSIIADLGGFRDFSWVFAAFLLTQAITIPLYGKLADLFGRKPAFIAGTTVFLVGSTLSGFAHSMLQLIVYRTVQGIGAGAVQPIAMTVVGDIYTAEERGRIQGYLSGVWGISSIVGPALGAFFVQTLNWSVVFWVNIPIGLAAMAMLAVFLDENVARKPHRIDYAGAALLGVTVSVLLVLMLQGQMLGARNTWLPVLLGAAAAFAFAGFVAQEHRASEPVLPLSLWRSRVIAAGNVGSVLTGALMMGITAYLPTYVQGVLGRSPTVAGFTLAAMSVGWPLASTAGGRLMFRLDFRSTAVLGGVFLVLGAVLLDLLTPARGAPWAAAGAFVTGLGMGFSTTVFIVAIQASVPWHERGVATSSNMFTRLLGQALGTAAMGAALNADIARRLPGYAGRSSIDLLLNTASRERLGPSELARLSGAVAHALHHVYLITAALAIAALITTWFIPKGVTRRDEQ